MQTISFAMYVLMFCEFITCLVVLITCLKVFNFFHLFERFKSQNDAELNSSVWHLRRSEEIELEVLQEMKRNNRLLYELVERKRHPEEKDEVEYAQEDIIRHHKEPESVLNRYTKTESQILDDTHKSRIAHFQNIGRKEPKVVH